MVARPSAAHDPFSSYFALSRSCRNGVGEGALGGASSLVREDVPPGTGVVGVPAREIGATSDVICRHGKLDQLYP